jgi:hypothetical protein
MTEEDIFGVAEDIEMLLLDVELAAVDNDDGELVTLLDEVDGEADGIVLEVLVRLEDDAVVEDFEVVEAGKEDDDVFEVMVADEDELDVVFEVELLDVAVEVDLVVLLKDEVEIEVLEAMVLALTLILDWTVLFEDEDRIVDVEEGELVAIPEVVVLDDDQDSAFANRANMFIAKLPPHAFDLSPGQVYVHSISLVLTLLSRAFPQKH